MSKDRKSIDDDWEGWKEVSDFVGKSSALGKAGFSETWTIKYKNLEDYEFYGHFTEQGAFESVSLQLEFEVSEKEKEDLEEDNSK